MLIKKMNYFDVGNVHSLGTFFYHGIRRSPVRISTNLLIKHGAELVSKISINAGKKTISDAEVFGTEEKFRASKMIVRIGDKKIYFLYFGGNFYCDMANLKDLKVFVYRIVLKYSNTLPKVVRTPRQTFDTFIDQTKNLYINKSTYEEILDSLRPFISTYIRRNQFNLNMCLSIIFRGDPGDGKTYNGKHMASWAAHLLALRYIEEEHTVFDKAAKLCPNFAALIDDMNASHFRRDQNGGVGSICQNILSEMDKPNCNRLFILTTNEEVSKENMDAAFFRPGRVQNIITFKRPDEELKGRIVDDIFSKLTENNVNVDKNFSHGVKMFALDTDLSLAEVMRLRTLITTDVIMEDKLGSPQSYIEKSKAFKVEVHNEDNT